MQSYGPSLDGCPAPPAPTPGAETSRVAAAAAESTPAQRQARGRADLLARRFDAAERQFRALRQLDDPRHRHDGEVGLAMVRLATCTPLTAPQPPASGEAAGEAAGTAAEAPAAPARAPNAPGGRAPAGPGGSFQAALATLRQAGPEPQNPSEMVRLGQLQAELQAGNLEQVCCRVALAPSSAEAVLAAAAYRTATDEPGRARQLLGRALGLFTGSVRIGLSPLQRNHGPEATAALREAYVAVGRLMADRGPFQQDLDVGDRLENEAAGSFPAMWADVMASPNGEVRRATWLALAQNWPRSAEVALLGVHFGFVPPDQEAALRAQRPGDAALLGASYAAALGREDWRGALESLERLHAVRPSVQQTGELAWLGRRCNRATAWVGDRTAQALDQNDAQPQALLAQAEANIATQRVGEACIVQLRNMAVGGRPEAYLYLARALKVQERQEEALEALNNFLQPANAASPHYGSALLLRAKHRLLEEGAPLLDHVEACAAVGLAHQDLLRIPCSSPSYTEAVRLQPFLADRRRQMSCGIRYRLTDLQVRAELAGKHFDRAWANLNHHGNSIENQESEAYWQLNALLYEAMGPGHYAKARHAAANAVDLGLMRNRPSSAAEDILRRLDLHRDSPLRRILSFFNGILGWFSGLFGAAH